ncbi:RNA polymerase II-specific DNA-binding transcription factor [Malassezia pachydermatis]
MPPPGRYHNDDGHPQRPSKTRRVRKNVSCVPCRVRKIRCDRNVPNCSSCVQRGIQHECCWGDERDEIREKDKASNAFTSMTPDLVRRMKMTVQSSSLDTYASTALAIPFFGAPFLAQLYEADRMTWSKFMATHLTILPSRKSVADIVEYYLRELEPVHSCVNESILRSQLDLLCTHIGLGSVKDVHVGVPTDSSHADIASKIAGSMGVQRHAKVIESSFWADARHYGLLALLYAILFVACDAMGPSEVQAMHVCEYKDAAGIENYIDTLHNAGLFFFQQSGVVEMPTLWTLQNFILLPQKYLNTRSMNMVVVWNRMAVSMAQSMGLNRLGSAADDITRKHKPKVPNGDFLSRMDWTRDICETDLPQRELARKIWCVLIKFDWYRSVHIDYTYCVCDAMNRTSPPAFLEDDEVLRVNTFSMDVLQDRTRPSPNAYVHVELEIGKVIRSMAEILLERRSRMEDASLTYAEALDIDGRFRRIIASLPLFLRFDVPSEWTQHVDSILEQHPYLKIQRLFIHEQIYYRLLRLHIPFLTKPDPTQDHTYSAESCIEGARISLAVREELQRTGNPNRNSAYLFWHLLTAATVLQRIISHYPLAPARRSSLVLSLRKALGFLEVVPAPAWYKTSPDLQAASEAMRRFAFTLEPEDVEATQAPARPAPSVQTPIPPAASAAATATPSLPTPAPLPTSSTPLAPPSTAILDNGESLTDTIDSLLTLPPWSDSDSAAVMAGLDFLLQYT